METLEYVFRLLAVSQVVIWGLYCIWFHRTPVGYQMLALSVFFACYLISPFTSETWQWGYLSDVVHFAGNLIPALVWLLAYGFFVDSPRIPKLFFFTTIVYLLPLMTPVVVQNSLLNDPGLRQVTFFFVPQMIKLVFVLHVAYLALRGRETDLVEKRLQLRTPVALALAAVTSAVISIEIGFSDEVPMAVRAWGAALLFLFTVTVTLCSIKIRPGLAAVLRASPEAAPSSLVQTSAGGAGFVVDQALVQKIQTLIEIDRFYANYDVTLDVMADHLEVPAYKLRRTINQHLGFRNFNQFLNSYRIAEADKRLIEDRKLPILTIALDIGFKSLSAFNRAFKDKHLMTPSAYRDETLRVRNQPD